MVGRWAVIDQLQSAAMLHSQVGAQMTNFCHFSTFIMHFFYGQTSIFLIAKCSWKIILLAVNTFRPPSTWHQCRLLKQTVSWFNLFLALSYFPSECTVGHLCRLACARFISHHRQHVTSCRCIVHYAYGDRQCYSWPTGKSVFYFRLHS